MRTPALIPALAVLILSGCASGGSSAGDQSGYERNRITFEELQALAPGTAFDAVQQLRPAWLRGRAGTLRTRSGRAAAVVFLDGRPFGDLVALYDFGSHTIAELRFISPADATIRFGTGYTGGIINVISRR